MKVQVLGVNPPGPKTPAEPVSLRRAADFTEIAPWKAISTLPTVGLARPAKGSNHDPLRYFGLLSSLLSGGYIVDYIRDYYRGY